MLCNEGKWAYIWNPGDSLAFFLDHPCSVIKVKGKMTAIKRKKIEYRMIEDSESSGMRAWVTLPDKEPRAFEAFAESNRKREWVVKEGSHRHPLTSYPIIDMRTVVALHIFSLLVRCVYLCILTTIFFLSHFYFICKLLGVNFTIYSLGNRIFSGTISEYEE